MRTHKLELLGAEGVGKTALVMMLVTQYFVATVGHFVAFRSIALTSSAV
jgi:GTPase SAR1 family protein